MEPKYLQILQESLLFEGLGGPDLQVTLECLKPQIVPYRKNDCITLAGTKLSGLGIMLGGEAVVTKENASGNRIIMAVLYPGEIFGEMAAFASESFWPATVLAQKDCVVMFLPPGRIVGECQKVCRSHERLIVNMLRILSEKALALNKKVEYLAMKSLRGKIGHYLLEQYRRSGSKTFMMPLNRNELADFLGISRPSLSREMGRMRDEGMIEFHRESLRINDLAGLQQVAE